MLATLSLTDTHGAVVFAAAAVGMGLTLWFGRRSSPGTWAIWAGFALVVASVVAGIDGAGPLAPDLTPPLLMAGVFALAAGGGLAAVEVRAADRRAKLTVQDLDTARRELDRLNGTNVRLEDELQETRRRVRSGEDQRNGSGAMLEATLVRQRKALETANVAARRHRAVFEGLLEGMAFLERETLRLDDTNPALARMTGWETKELAGKTLLDLLAPGPTCPGRTDLQRCARERRPISVTMLRKDGQTVPVELTISVTGAGEEAQLVAVARDVAERFTVDRDHEDAVQTLRERLRRLEGEAAALDESNHKLEDANRRLTELGDRKDHYLSMVSHELRTPLTSIRSFSEILIRHGDTEPAIRKEFLEIIHKESERLTRLVNNVLDLARIEAGATKLLLSEFDARTVAADAAQSMRGVATDRRVEVQVAGGDAERPMRADRDRVQQVLMNLLGNAIRHSPEGSSVAVEIAAGDRPERVRFTVRDHGSGIPQQDLERVFDRFQRGGEEPASVGTGLGLAICREIASLHGGRIWAESPAGVGAVFHVEFPGVEESRTRSAGLPDRPERAAPRGLDRLPPISDRPLESPSSPAPAQEWAANGSLPPLGRR